MACRYGSGSRRTAKPLASSGFRLFALGYGISSTKAAVERDALVRDSRGYDPRTRSNAVTARSLRRKLGSKPSMIEAVRGIGYRPVR